MNPEPRLWRRKTRQSAFRRKSVTVCIAAVAGYEDIVIVTDKKLSKGIYSADDASIKTTHLIGDWAAMIAGQIEQVRGFIPYFGREAGDNFYPRLDEVTKMLSVAYQKFAQQLATERILGRLGLDLPSFLKCRADLGDAVYERLLTEISRM